MTRADIEGLCERLEKEDSCVFCEGTGRGYFGSDCGFCRGAKSEPTVRTEAATALRAMLAERGAMREAIRLFPEAHYTLTRQEMRDAKGNWRSLIQQQTNALRRMGELLAQGAPDHA